MGKPQLEKSEATNGQNSSSTKCNSKQTVEKSNEHPEWLPDGWEVDFRTRKSGANMGHWYKCYIDPTGHKFYSKPEVLQYLETINSNSCTSKKEEICKSNDVVEKFRVEDSPPGWITKIKTGKGNYDNRKDPDAVEKSSVEGLPPGWITEIKMRKDGNRKDLFYVDPVDGYVFRSKKDALCYLKSGDISTCVIKPHKRQIQDEEKITPSSAGKKQKLKQSAMKRQPFVDQEIYDESTLELPGANSSKIGHDVTVSSGMMVAHVAPVEPIIKNQSSENAAAYATEMKKTSDPDDVQKNCVVNVLGNASKQNHSNCSLSKTKKFNVAPRFSRRLAGTEPDQLTNVTDEQTLLVPKRNLRKGKTVLDTDLTNKPFLPLSGVLQVEHSHKMQGEVLLLSKSSKLSEGQAGFGEQPHQVETNKIEDNKQEKDQHSLSGNSSSPSLKVARKTTRPNLPSLDNPHSEAHVLKEKKLHANGTGKSGLQKIHLNSNKSSNKKEHQIPCRASKRLAGFEPELMSSSISNGRAPEYKSKRSRGEVNATLQRSESRAAMELADHASITGEISNKSRKPPETPPITSDQLKKLDEEGTNDEKSEPQQSFAFHYSWSDPCLEFAIQTLTGALPVEDSVVNRPTRIPETDIFSKNNLVKNVTESSGDKNSSINSKKSKNRKELAMPRRLSNRLAGHEPEVLPTERAIEYTTRKSCKDRPTSTVILTDGTSGHLHAGEESQVSVHSSDRFKTLCGKSPNKSEKPYDTQTVPNEQLQRLEAENVDYDGSNSQFSPFGKSWSDPCLEFAIKTLTDALPVDAATADILPVMTSDVNDPPNNKLLERTELKSIGEKVHDNPNQSQTKKEFNTVCQPSKQVLDQPELRTCSTSCGNDPKFATTKFYSDDYNIIRNFNGREAQHIEAGNARQIDINAQILEKPSTKKLVLEGESVAEKLQPETIDHDNSKRSFCVSFMDSWSDTCLDSASKTLTGAIPVEEPADSHDHREGGSTLPEFGFSSIPQSDISFHNDMGEKSKPGQKLSTSSSFLPQEKPSLHGFSGVDPQYHYFQCSNNFQRK